MAHHEIKIMKIHADKILNGSKPWEVRKNDRYYQKDDTVEMTEIKPSFFNPHQTEKTGRVITATVGDVYPGDDRYGIGVGWVVFGLLDIELQEVKPNDRH